MNRKVIFIVCMGSMQVTRPLWQWAHAATAFFFANKASSGSNNTSSITQYGQQATAARVDSVRFDKEAYIGCKFNSPPPNESFFKAHVDTHLSGVFTQCTKQISGGASWVNAHKVHCFGAGLVLTYGYFLFRILGMKHFLKGADCWGIWHAECNFDLLTPSQCTKFREELLVTLQQRYPHRSDVIPVHSFMRDLDKELDWYIHALKLIDRVEKVDGYAQYIITRIKDTYIGLLGNTPKVQAHADRVFAHAHIQKLLFINDTIRIECEKRRKHLLQLKAFYAEWLTTVRAIFKQQKL